MFKIVAVAAAALTLATGAQAQSRHGNYGAQVATGVAVGVLTGILIDRATQPPVYVQRPAYYSQPRQCVVATAYYDAAGYPHQGVFCR